MKLRSKSLGSSTLITLISLIEEWFLLISNQNLIGNVLNSTIRVQVVFIL
ncbi:hypothetical protein HETIRDRAFT_163239 [Heterobasidion irregulare TC 32-1]|uniref:Uncharacterized protein n=1 Tax=Heterobasidion irregulare (strain TC 32-1) TaxID=747525 RepID=W4KAL6_HETIT|nr:uncharacterized protein HETIRDRAFT_163239 [Heterobasidion irregulare TC 32-1]ETW82823.1 hypothetical protein HETIRDRAFT_163239 [Heterobasidion irregulare TC 32-1]